jgi:hypothetical protein
VKAVGGAVTTSVGGGSVGTCELCDDPESSQLTRRREVIKIKMNRGRIRPPKFPEVIYDPISNVQIYQ